MSIDSELDRLIHLYQNRQAKIGWPKIEREEEWPSACYLEETEVGELTEWRPVKIQESIDMFERLSTALGTDVHPDLVNYYSAYWSDPLFFQHPEGELSLLFCWNQTDFERLRANFIGHSLNKKKQREPLTFFFACTEPDPDFFLSINNESGEIWIESATRGAVRKIADCLIDFLSELEPLPYPQ